MSNEIQITKHQFGPGVIRELATKLYRSPIDAFREAVSNGLDAMVPFEEKKIVIRTDVPPHGDIEIEDWGTGIENYDSFTVISPGEKIVQGEVSSYEKFNEKIIGQKGMGKLSFLDLSNTGTVEFHSNNESVGMKVTMTMEGFTVKHMNGPLVLPHRGLKVVIKNAKGSSPDSKKLVDYLGKYFAIRISKGVKIFVNDIQIHKPNDFDPLEVELFTLNNGIKAFGNLKPNDKPKSNNIDIFVKQVYAEGKGFDYKVDGWVNCNSLDLKTSRDGIYEGNDVYMEFIRNLGKYLNENYEKNSQANDTQVKSEKHIAKNITIIFKTIHNLYPEMGRPFLSGAQSELKGMGEFSNMEGDSSSPCTENDGVLDEMYTEEQSIGKPIGNGKSHRTGNEESYARFKKGEGKILSPSMLVATGSGAIPEPKIVVIEAEDKPVVFFSAPNRLVINRSRRSSSIILDANPKDPTIKSRILPLLVMAGLDAFPGSSELSKDEWLKKYDAVLNSVY